MHKTASPSPATPAPALTEWRQHWPLVLAASIGFSFAALMSPAIGIFMAPIGHEFGWSRTELSLGLAMSAGLSLFCSPFIGAAIDRLGTRRLAIPGLILAALATSAFSLVDNSLTHWLMLWLVWGVAVMLIQSNIWSTAVASVFSAGRGLALGLTLSGTALAQVIAPPLTNWLITAFGWRSAFVWLGLGWGSIALLLSAFFLFDSRDLSRTKRAAAHAPVTDPASIPGLSIREARRNSALWRVGIASFLILSVTIAVTVHTFPIFRAAGIAADHAAWLASLTGVAGIVGKLVTGALIDRYHARWVGGITLASTAIAYPLMMQSVGLHQWIVAATMISGYAAGTKIQLCGYLTARYAGMRNYGAIFGVMTSAIALASAVGPLLGGKAYDVYGNYDVMLMVGTLLSLLSGALIFSLPAYPDWNKAPAA